MLFNNLADTSGVIQNPSLPLVVFVISILGYCLGRLSLEALKYRSRGRKQINLRLSEAVEPEGQNKNVKLEIGLFELEKRAFFSKTWLFVCHQSKFIRPGDYHTFIFAGISFFIVLGKDLKLRAFHNVCRHRAYTVVRKSCGTSARFSCKYHGWQYDDKGSLVKAPKFDQSPGFNPEENGLYEVKLLRTQEGLVRVNFAASAIILPFDNLTSRLGMGHAAWIDGFDKKTDLNWKIISQDIASKAQRGESTWSWFPSTRKHRSVQSMGPLAILREMGDEAWCTMKVLPESYDKTTVRTDFYARAGRIVPADLLKKYKLLVENEILALQIQQSEAKRTSSNFSYECGGRNIDLGAILAQHQRAEILARKKLQPRIRLGKDIDDQEAVAICDALDARQVMEESACSKTGDFVRKIEW